MYNTNKNHDVYKLLTVVILGKVYFISSEKVNENLLGILYCFP